MASLTITITSTKKSADVQWPLDYVINSGDPAVESFKSLIPTFQTWLTSGPFVFTNPAGNESPDGMTRTYYVTVSDISTVPGLTAASAAYLFRQYGEASSRDIGLSDFQVWRLQYMYDHCPYTLSVAVN
jgi:hypothetical protein